jgi:D-3-phosphoglycerate dehydrogenase
VYEKEPYTGPLQEIPNTLLTCHMGSYAAETRLSMEEEAAQNLIQAFRGRREKIR